MHRSLLLLILTCLLLVGCGREPVSIEDDAENSVLFYYFDGSVEEVGLSLSDRNGSNSILSYELDIEEAYSDSDLIQIIASQYPRNKVLVKLDYNLDISSETFQTELMQSLINNGASEEELMMNTFAVYHGYFVLMKGE